MMPATIAPSGGSFGLDLSANATTPAPTARSSGMMSFPDGFTEVGRAYAAQGATCKAKSRPSGRAREEADAGRAEALGGDVDRDIALIRAEEHAPEPRRDRERRP